MKAVTGLLSFLVSSDIRSCLRRRKNWNRFEPTTKRKPQTTRPFHSLRRSKRSRARNWITKSSSFVVLRNNLPACPKKTTRAFETYRLKRVRSHETRRFDCTARKKDSSQGLRSRLHREVPEQGRSQ